MKKVLFILLILSVYSCGLKPLISNTDYISLATNKVTLENLGNGKILFYSGGYFTSEIEYIAGTSKMNILIDGMPIGQINYGEYFIINLKEGIHKVKLIHKDVLNFKSQHEIIINENSKIFELRPTALGNMIKERNLFPEDFKIYRQLQ
jgi:hypothetical protein